MGRGAGKTGSGGRDGEWGRLGTEGTGTGGVDLTKTWVTLIFSLIYIYIDIDIL